MNIEIQSYSLVIPDKSKSLKTTHIRGIEEISFSLKDGCAKLFWYTAKPKNCDLYENWLEFDVRWFGVDDDEMFIKLILSNRVDILNVVATIIGRHDLISEIERRYQADMLHGAKAFSPQVSSRLN